jgi:hypothetical protein
MSTKKIDDIAERLLENNLWDVTYVLEDLDYRISKAKTVMARCRLNEICNSIVRLMEERDQDDHEHYLEYGGARRGGGGCCGYDAPYTP